MKKKILEVRVTPHEAYIELSGMAQKFDLIIPVLEYNKIGRPLPGDTLEVNFRVVHNSE